VRKKREAISFLQLIAWRGLHGTGHNFAELKKDQTADWDEYHLGEDVAARKPEPG
jgi:hypothetical protein